jgi:DNA polymerase-1
MAKIVGFFSDEELDTVGLNGPGSGECDKCGLASGCKTPQMGYTGEGGKGILIVAEAPSDSEDQSGKPMTGETGEWFRDKLKAKGINLDKDCWKTNAVGCHPANLKDKKPTKNHIKHCRPRLMKTIEELKPKFIWLMGNDAIYSYYNHREDNTSCDRWRGLCVPDPDKKAWILPLYHPQYAIRMSKDDHFQATYDRDLSHAIRCSRSSEVPEHMDIKGAKILKTFDDVMDQLEKVHDLRPDKFAFDYETTGLKPYRAGHRIATASFCYDYDTSYAFPYQYRQHFTTAQQTEIADLWCDILEMKGIHKIAHNSKFEDMWTREIFGIDIANLWWCSMNTAHILDSRTEFSGLKFQALIRWGTPDYDSSMEKYIKAAGKNVYNKVMEAPLNDLLLYNSIDSLLTFRLQEEQQEDLKNLPKMESARQFFMTGLNVLCNMQENGIPLNRKYYVDQDVTIGKRITEMTNNLYNFPEAQKFMRARGRQINFNSSPDLADLFFKILDLPKGKLTAGGADCVDKDVLAGLNTPIAKEITKISKLDKIKGTYLGQFNREIEDDDKLHPFFDLHTTNTFRGSSSCPNFQNIPVRDTEAMNITRGGIIPTMGNILDDWDYGSMEVRIIACITHDPVLMKYIEDPTSDIHRDQAMELFCFNKAEWDHMVSINKKNPKDIRFHAKNGMVFALFYGSYYRSIARTLFALLKELNTGECTLFEHLRSKGIIRSLSSAAEDFENHVKRVEQKFWNRFKGVKKWQEKAFASYLEKGYIEQMFGFRVSGWLTRNDICNYPVQGTAFHCLVWSIHRLDYQMKEEKMHSKLIGQIHDCCLADVVPTEQDRWDAMSYNIATKEIREVHPWIIVPLDIEFEKTEVNAPWSTKKEFHPTFQRC